MAVKTLKGEYPIVMMDSVDRFHGNQLVFIGWDYHTSISTAGAYPLPPDMPFGALTEAVLPSVMGPHPDFPQIQWDKVEWMLDGESFTPDMGKSLKDNGVGHKSLIRFRTPGLEGYQGTGN
ncbi:phenol hydroxylase subunit P4 [Thiothrix nivea]|uniref:Phenol 2-monooxygenase P4 subunit n=1 Tax=Thiothrix nivea (strain ATCC 35100 / DSM 5205 / JP2) TaxID=870187 RepID=A0A656HKD1_THINJ|nr:phenol hydroxylase subunit P4 [Thiothrix nivea]EIJ36692.1 phenol 2-monooxygenase P4 subunit [Thiothrix nivea DSM 5205]